MSGVRNCEPKSLLSGVLAFLEHVLNRRLVDHQVGRAGAVELDAALVVPLDVAVDFFSVAQHHDHGGLGLHLLLVVEVLGVGLLGRGTGLFGGDGARSRRSVGKWLCPWLLWSVRLSDGRISLRFAKP